MKVSAIAAAGTTVVPNGGVEGWVVWWDSARPWRRERL